MGAATRRKLALPAFVVDTYNRSNMSRRLDECSTIVFLLCDVCRSSPCRHRKERSVTPLLYVDNSFQHGNRGRSLTTWSEKTAAKLWTHLHPRPPGGGRRCRRLDELSPGFTTASVGHHQEWCRRRGSTHSYGGSARPRHFRRRGGHQHCCGQQLY